MHMVSGSSSRFNLRHCLWRTPIGDNEFVANYVPKPLGCSICIQFVFSVQQYTVKGHHVTGLFATQPLADWADHEPKHANGERAIFHLSVKVATEICSQSNTWCKRVLILLWRLAEVLYVLDIFSGGLFGCICTQKVLKGVWLAHRSSRTTQTWSRTEVQSSIIGEEVGKANNKLKLTYDKGIRFFYN